MRAQVRLALEEAEQVGACTACLLKLAYRWGVRTVEAWSLRATSFFVISKRFMRLPGKC